MTTIDRALIISKVIAKYLTGGLDVNEQQLLDQWLLEDANNKNIFDRIVNQNDISAALLALEQTRIEPVLSIVNARIAQLDTTPIKTSGLWPGIRIAASIAAAVATIVFGIWFFAYRSDTSDNFQTGMYANDIAPGKNGATVTLSTGEVIRLDSTKQGVKIDPTSLTYDDGSKGAGFGLKAESEVQMTAQTQKGQTYIFTLPDGSKVWLNAATTLKFPSTFAKKISREVEVDGEAYFEVFKNKSQPFVVKSKKRDNLPEQEITVLGTHFNVNNYAEEENVKTTLLEGSVRVASLLSSSARRSAEVVLEPGQQALGTEDALKVRAADVQQAVAWKNGFFQFTKAPLTEVMQELSRWYDVEVLYEGAKPTKLFSGQIYRYLKLSQVFEILSFYEVKFKIEGKKLIVYN